MKRQFLPKTPFQSNEQQPEGASSSTMRGSKAQAPSRSLLSLFAQQQKVSSPTPSPIPQSQPPIQSSRAAGPGTGASKGLLSGWKSGQLPPPNQQRNHHPHPASASVVEQDTLEQPLIQTSRPITGPVGNPGAVQIMASRQVSPHQSDIGPIDDLFGNMSRPVAPSPMTNAQILQRPAPQAGPSIWQRLPPEEWSPGLTSAPGINPYTPPSLMPITIGPAPKKQARKKKRRVPIWAKVVLSLLLVLLVSVGSVAAYLYFTFAPIIGNIANQQVPRQKGEADPNLTRGSGGDILSGGRINILLLGSDTDQKFTNADGTHTYLAQTDIVVSIDPATQHVVMLSIPRDFWINVPGAGMHKLDEAFGLGNAATTPPGNVDLSRYTIEHDFGIPINYYAWVGLSGFVKVIDTVGGVDVDVSHPIVDDNYPDDVGNTTGDTYAYKRLYIPPGPQHLSGTEALEYVRSRHADLVGDFGRSARQQQVLGDLKTKLTALNITDINKLHDLANDLNGYVKTDMDLAKIYKLMTFARSLDPSKIEHITLGPPYSTIGNVGTTSVVFPDCTKIVPIVAKALNLGNNAVCNIQANGSGGTQATLASAPQTIAPVACISTPLSALNPFGTASQMATLSPVNLHGANNDPFGIHSLLYLLFLGVFESPNALSV